MGNWEDIRKNVDADAENIRTKSTEGKLISQSEAALVRESELYAQMDQKKQIKQKIKEVDHIAQKIKEQEEAINRVSENKKMGDAQDIKNATVDAQIKSEQAKRDVVTEIDNLLGKAVNKDGGLKEGDERVEKYKEEIIESIIEIENVADRKINRTQFVMDYLREQDVDDAVDMVDNITQVISQERLEQQSEIEKTRDAAQITLGRVRKFEYLNADTVDQGDEKFKRTTRAVWREFAVHGKFYKDEETGEVRWNKRGTDLDGSMSLRLLKEAKIQIKNLLYVAPGEYESGKINIDTGSEDGLVILDDGTVIIDHHGEDSGNDSSGTKLTYDILNRLGVLERTDVLDRMVEFVNQVDNFNYPNQKEYFADYFNNSWRTFLGLHNMASAGVTMKFFRYKKNGKALSPTEPLGDDILKDLGFSYRSKGFDKSKVENHKERVRKSYEKLQQMKKDGFIIQSQKYGQICVNAYGVLDVNKDAAKAFGCDTYLVWNQANNNFFMSSLTGKNIVDEFEQGKNIRKTMLIKPDDGTELTMKLRDMLNQMTDGTLEPSEKLEEALKNNGALI